MTRTEYHCPSCESHGQREYLVTEIGLQFVCLVCKKAYSADALVKLYRAEAEGLETDAVYVRGLAEELRVVA